jgi:hypothetical protein
MAGDQKKEGQGKEAAGAAPGAEKSADGKVVSAR